MPNTPLVSVIVPVFNGADFIGPTIESVLRQTYANIEVIVVDDGSTDDTHAVMESYAARDSRVRILRQPNNGVARARNHGLAQARGEFIAPLDSDDLWEPTKIERQVQRMLECGEDAGLVYCWWVWIDGHGAVMDRSPNWRVEGEGLETLLKVNYTGNASIPLFRRSSLDQVGGYDEQLAARGGPGCEDWDLALRIAARFRVAVVPELLVGYRRRPDSMSTSLDAMWQSHLFVAEGLRQRQPEVDEQSLRWSKQQFALYLAGVAFWSGAYYRAFAWALHAWPSALFFRVIPYAVLVIFRRIGLQRPSHRQVMTPGRSLDPARIRAPLVPYDRIYAQRSDSDAARAPGIVDALLRSRPLQMVAIVLAFLFIASLHAANDGLWFQGDAPRHAANGFFWWDLVETRPAAIMDFAVRYYARYPVISPVSYPPLFYLLEGLAFQIFHPSPYVAKYLVLAFAVLAGIYTMAWARRWVAPWAGWAGVFLAFLPGVVLFTNAVMLNIPAMALSMACLYHFRHWLDSRSGRQFWLAAASFTFVLLTYYAAATVLFVCAAWVVLWRAVSWRTIVRKRGFLLAASAGVIALIPVLLSVAVPALVARHLPVPALLARLGSWTYYWRTLPDSAGIAGLMLGSCGIAAGMAAARWRKEAACLAVWIFTLLLVHSVLPAQSGRYVLLTAPALVISMVVGLASLGSLFPAWRARTGASLLAVGLAAGMWSASRVHVPEVSGFREVAAYLREQGAQDAVLYDGYHDGIFSFYVRASDPGFERRVVLGDRLMYYNGPTTTFDWVETSRVASTGDVIDILRAESGCRWVALEMGPKSEWSRPQQLLRKAIQQSGYPLVRSFAVAGSDADRVDVYRISDPVQDVAAMDLKFPAYRDHVFTHVVPITR